MEYYLCLLDFEATCWDDGNVKFQNSIEIIEFPSVLYKINELTNTSEFISEFQKYVKPTTHPILTKFCTELTGITQEQVSTANTIDIVYKEHIKWLNMNIPFESELIIATCGNWDLKIQLPREIRNKKLKPHPYYSKFINVLTEFKSFYKRKPGGMVGMLEFLNIPLEGKHHSGIDDSRNTMKIMLRMIDDGLTYQNMRFQYL